MILIPLVCGTSLENQVSSERETWVLYLVTQSLHLQCFSAEKNQFVVNSKPSAPTYLTSLPTLAKASKIKKQEIMFQIIISKLNVYIFFFEENGLAIKFSSAVFTDNRSESPTWFYFNSCMDRNLLSLPSGRLLKTGSRNPSKTQERKFKRLNHGAMVQSSRTVSCPEGKDPWVMRRWWWLSCLSWFLHMTVL